MAAKPVFAPCSIPAADSAKTPKGVVPVTEAIIVPTESITNAFWLISLC
nr:hypothetical protein [Mesoplasma melaleucae]